MNDNTATKQELNNLIEFRHHFYDCLNYAKDAQFQLVAALLSDRDKRDESFFANLSFVMFNHIYPGAI